MNITPEQIIEVLNEQLATARATPSMKERAEIIDELIDKIYERQEMLAMISHISPPMQPFMD